jgi:type II secretory pathway component PulF
MATFVWRGRTLAGEAQAGEIEVGRQEEALELLRKKKILVTSLRPKGGFKLAPRTWRSSRGSSPP